MRMGGRFENGTRKFRFASDGTFTVVFDPGLELVLDSPKSTSKTFTAHISAPTDQGVLVTDIPIVAGRIDLVADLNNDTVINEDDIKLKPVQNADPQNQGKPDQFAFWEASNIKNM